MTNILEMMALLKNFSKSFGLKLIFIIFIMHFTLEEPCTSQRQAIIKLIEKKDKDKILI